MAKMSVAAVAVDLGPAHEKAAVDAFADSLGVERPKERRPSGAAVELGRSVKERSPAARAAEGAGTLGKVIVGEGAFGAMFAHDLEAEIPQSRAPFGIRLGDFVHLRTYPVVVVTGI